MDLIARFICILMVLVVNYAIGVEGAAYGEDCSSATCDDTNNICKTNLCICDTGFFRKTSIAECAARVAINKVCEAAQTASDQCSIANSECRDDSGTDKCLCKPTHYETGGACVLKVGLDGTCDTTDSATDQCSVADTECRDDGAGSKCLCKATHYSDGSACVIRIKPNIACTAADQCVTHATCDTTDTDKCVCDASYTPSPIISPTMCSGVVKFSTQTCTYVVSILVSMMFLL